MNLHYSIHLLLCTLHLFLIFSPYPFTHYNLFDQLNQSNITHDFFDRFDKYNIDLAQTIISGTSDSLPRNSNGKIEIYSSS